MKGADPAEPTERWEDDEVAEGTAEPEYRRRRQPVRVRRRRWAEWAGWARRGWKPLLAAAVAVILALGLNSLLFHSAWFVLAGSDQITVAGAHQASPERIAGVFSSDLGRNVWFIPLEARRQAIEALPWVRSAAVLRLFPDRLQVQITERVPVAFARAGEQLVLVDASGVVLGRPAQGNYNFPVLSGLPGTTAAEPNTPALLGQRAAGLKLFTQLRQDLDADGSHHSRDLSEIDVSDPNDVQARVSLPGAAGSTVLVHFGDRNFAARYALFLSQIAGWRQKYPGLASVDLHFDGEAVVDPGAPPPPPAASPVVPKKPAVANPAAHRGGKKP